MTDGMRWHSKSGLWCKTDDEDNKPANLKPTSRASTNGEVIEVYVSYLENAMNDAEADADHEGKYKFDAWNAKKLVWEMGNEKSLAAIRNAVYKFNDLVDGFKLDTLGSGPRITVSKAERKAAAKAKVDKRGWAKFSS